MNVKKIIDNESFSLWYYPDEKIIHHKFRSYVYGKTLRDSLTEGLKLMKDEGAEKWLSDDRENPTLSNEDIEWGRNVWGNAAKDAGWKYWAIILPDSILGKSNMAQSLKDVQNKGIVIKVFNKPEDAISWLKKL